MCVRACCCCGGEEEKFPPEENNHQKATPMKKKKHNGLGGRARGNKRRQKRGKKSVGLFEVSGTGMCGGSGRGRGEQSMCGGKNSGQTLKGKKKCWPFFSLVVFFIFFLFLPSVSVNRIFFFCFF